MSRLEAAEEEWDLIRYNQDPPIEPYSDLRRRVEILMKAGNVKVDIAVKISDLLKACEAITEAESQLE